MVIQNFKITTDIPLASEYDPFLTFRTGTGGDMLFAGDSDRFTNSIGKSCAAAPTAY